MASNMMEITIGKVIIGILIMLIMTAFLDPESASTELNSSQYNGLVQMRLLFSDDLDPTRMVDESIVLSMANQYLISYPNCYYLSVFNYTILDNYDSFR